MKKKQYISLQVMVFSLVWAAFTTIYITQPVLPVLQVEFGVNESMASLSISAVVLGIALANLPFGILADRFPIRPIILTGGLVISACGLFCAITTNLLSLVLARFVQGLFIPSLTTCLAAYLARSLPMDRLNVVMGTYVSATVAGGLSGRLLGGWIHPPLHWRYAFLSASVFLLIVTFAAAHWLKDDEKNIEPDTVQSMGFMALLSRGDMLRIYFVAFGAFFVFSSIFNYLPFYLTGPPFNASTNTITMLYLSYIVGIVVSPAAGELSNRIGNGASMVLGSLVLSLAIMATLINSLVVVAISLMGVCAGFFTIHSAAAGSLNRKLTSNRGHANSLYILFYYIGGYVGITASGFVYGYKGWTGVAVLGITILLLPLTAGIVEMRHTTKDHQS
ncbi:MAG: MFS transporter [Deltaproteobacteria bacterium]|nr:MFS transporter [Deltaproteobacteria bacterium]